MPLRPHDPHPFFSTIKNKVWNAGAAAAARPASLFLQLQKTKFGMRVPLRPRDPRLFFCNYKNQSLWCGCRCGRMTRAPIFFNYKKQSLGCGCRCGRMTRISFFATIKIKVYDRGCRCDSILCTLRMPTTWLGVGDNKVLGDCSLWVNSKTTRKDIREKL